VQNAKTKGTMVVACLATEGKLGKSEKKGAFQQQKQPRECMLLSLSYSELIHSTNHSALSEKKAAL